MTLPQGWVEATVADLAAPEPRSIVDGPFGSALKSEHYTESGARVIRLTNIGDRAFLGDDVAYISLERFEGLKSHEAQAGDLVTAALGDPLGRTCAVPNASGPSIVKADCFRTRVSPEVDASYVLLSLNSPATRKSFVDRSRGVGRVRINLEILRSTTVPVAPKAEQRRIVAKLDALTARLARARAELDRVPLLTAKLRQAILSDVRTRVAAAPQLRVAEVAASTFDGPFGSNLKSADYSAEGVRVIRLENIGHLRFVADRKTYIQQDKYAGLTRHTLRPGDVLFSSFVDQQVRVCRLPEDAGLAINKADCFAIRIAEDANDARFVAYMLASPATYEAMRAKVHGATRPRIGLSQLRDYRLPVPDLSYQRYFADLLDTAFAHADRLEAKATRARALIDRLEAAILALAFRGELIPQDPADEPANVLLDRISARRQADRARSVRKRCL